MIILGLTGSIATGKSTVAKMFKNLGINVFNDDKIANEIISSKRMLNYFQKNFNEAINNNELDKKKLKNIVLKDINKLQQLENIVHPLVNIKRDWFVLKNKVRNSKGIIMFDCPLLFEVGIDKYCNFIIVTYCSLKTQKERIAERSNLTEDEFSFILKRQLPSEEKIQKANFSINTDNKKEQTLKEVEKILFEVINSCKNKFI